MSDANIDLLDDDCLLEIFERMSLFDQVCASDVCRRWRAMCTRFLEKVYILTGTGRFWLFKSEDESTLAATVDCEAVKLVLKSCSRYLRRFRLTIVHRPDDPSELQLIMGIATARCKNLDSIYFKETRDLIIGKLIPIMIQHNRNLTSFKGEDSYGFILRDVIQHLPKSLTGFQLLNDQNRYLYLLIPLLTSSQNFICFGCYDLPDILAELIGTQEKLEILLMKRAFTIAASFDHIANLKNLRVLDVEMSPIKDEHLVKIAQNCQELHALIITSCNDITDIGISSLANLEKLRELKMRQLHQVTDASIAILPASLKLLYCCRCEGVLNDGMIQFLTRATDLQELYIGGSRITNVTIEAAIRIVKDQGSSRNLTIYAENSRADLDTIDETLIAQLPPSLQLYI